MALDTVGFEPYCIIRRLQQWSPCAEPSLLLTVQGISVPTGMFQAGKTGKAGSIRFSRCAGRRGRLFAP